MKKIYNVIVNYTNITPSEKFDESSIQISEDKERFYLAKKSEGWDINTKDLKILGLPNISSNPNINLQDKKIYRYPHLNLPRQKVDLLKEKYNVKIIRDPNKADVHIISTKALESLFAVGWSHIISFTDFFDIIKKIVDRGLVSNTEYERLKLLINNMDKDSMIHFNAGYYAGDDTVPRRLYKKIKKLSGDRLQEKNIFVSKVNLMHYNNIINSSKQITYDVDICNIIGSELAIIDNTQFDGVYAMLTSNDKENTAMAIEMLANCNIEKSFDVVSNLYFWHYDKFKYSTNWNTINVKTLRSRLTDYQGDHSTQQIWAFNKYIKLLKEDRKLTKWAIDNTRKLLLETRLNHIVGKDASVFKVDLENIYLNEEYQL